MPVYSFVFSKPAGANPFQQFERINEDNGLNRYDGYNFKIYSSDHADSNSFTGGLFYSLARYKNGIFWMNSENVEIHSFNPITGKFLNYSYNPRNNNSLADDITAGLAIEKNDNIWIATQTSLDKLNR